MNKIKQGFTAFLTFCCCVFIPVVSAAISCIDAQTLFEIKPDADQPSDIAMAANGDLYLVDGVNNRIIVVDDAGRRKFSFGREGTQPGEFRRPVGIDVSDKGEVFVADTGNHRIQVFDAQGTFLHLFAVKTGNGEKPADPVDVLASKLKNYLYIADNDNHKIRVYSQDGRYAFEWGKFGELPGEFRYPAIMATNEVNELYVVDVLNTRVQKFDPFGKHIADIGSWGVTPGKLFRPKGVVTDSKNRVFIGDSYMGVIQVFTDLGRFLGVLCENGQQRRFVTPTGIIVDERLHRLLVVEMMANKVSVLNIKP